jgi:hypothetical protein
MGLRSGYRSTIMATYSITFDYDEDLGKPEDQFATRAEADVRLAELQAAGTFARLLRWQNNQSLEVKCVNPPPGRR